MRNRSAFLATVLFICICGVISIAAQSRRIAPTATPTPKDDTERINTEEIKLNVLAFDERGAFFPDVNSNDLVITENNILHQPSSVRRIPANVLIVMDTGGEMRSVKGLDQTRKVAKAVVGSLRNGDSIALLQYSDKAEIAQEWTNDKQLVLNAINRTKFGRRDDFVGALKLARDFLVKNPADNRHLVLITDGTDSVSGSSAKFDALQSLLTTDISVHVISYTSMEAAASTSEFAACIGLSSGTTSHCRRTWSSILAAMSASSRLGSRRSIMAWIQCVFRPPPTGGQK